MSEKLLTLSEAAEILAMHRKTLWRRARAGTISYIRVGNRLKFRRTVIDRFITKREVGA